MKLISWSGQGAFVISVVSVLGYRADLLPFRLAFLLYLLALLLCVVVVGIGLFTLFTNLWRKRPLRLDYAVLVIACSIAPSVTFWSVGLDGIRAPQIHDITSDTVNPPVFLFTRD